MLSAPRGGVLFFTATSEFFCASRDGRRDATGGRVDGADTRWRASRRGSARSDAGENASFVSTARGARNASRRSSRDATASRRLHRFGVHDGAATGEIPSRDVIDARRVTAITP